MSDLQDIIANTSVKAFNSGYLQGAWDERMRILKIIADYGNKPTFDSANLISLIEGDKK